MINVLFLCTGNSARSVMAEALITILGRGRFQGFSAGSKPGGTVNPFAIEQILNMAPGYPTAALRSKSWDEFALSGAPTMDVVVTVCDNAAGEVCPFWPGRPATAHWGFADPAAIEGSDAQKRAAFDLIFTQIRKKIGALVELDWAAMDADAIGHSIKKIGALP